MGKQKNTMKCIFERRLILIDVENFNGGPVASPAQSQWCRRAILNWVKPSGNDLIVLAADKSTVTNLHAAWKSDRILIGVGQDGADLQLMEVFDEGIVGRFSEIALVSGDGIFSEKISELSSQGIPTTVYAHVTSLSKRLAFAATTVAAPPFSSPTPPAVSAVVSLRKVA